MDYFAPHHDPLSSLCLDRWSPKTPPSASHRASKRKCILVLFLAGLFLTGCQSREPSIEFTKVPPVGEGGPDKFDVIAGRVRGARKGQHIVLYAKSGVWWVQPFANQPNTPIGTDSGWSNSTHLGHEYAALLVEPDYQPVAALEKLPPLGSGVVQLANVEGVPGPPEAHKTIQFSGYEWDVRSTASEGRGGVYRYETDNAWTDGDGALHLRVVNKEGKWTCAEVNLRRSLGYGSYRFTVRDVSQLAPALVLSMFTRDDASKPDENHSELDIEVSRWDDPLSKNAQYVVQPYYVATNVARFFAPSGPLTYSFEWMPKKATFRTIREVTGTKQGRLIAEHIFNSGVPPSGDEVVHLDLYLFGNAANPIGKPAEVVFDKFEYLP